MFRAAAWCATPQSGSASCDDLARDAVPAGLHAHRAIRSPITGADGNVEFLVDLRREPAEGDAFETSSVEAVNGA